jgi:hypothetical protein
VSYIVLRLADGTFVHVSFHDNADGVNPIASTAAFAQFQDAHDESRAGPVGPGNCNPDW